MRAPGIARPRPPRLALATVGRSPGAGLQASLEAGEASLCHVAGGEPGHLPPSDHIVELGLLPVVGCDPDGGDAESGVGGPKLGCGDEPPGDDDPVEGCSSPGLGTGGVLTVGCLRVALLGGYLLLLLLGLIDGLVAASRSPNGTAPSEASMPWGLKWLGVGLLHLGP